MSMISNHDTSEKPCEVLQKYYVFYSDRKTSVSGWNHHKYYNSIEGANEALKAYRKHPAWDSLTQKWRYRYKALTRGDDIDFKKCYGCRSGINSFILKDYKLHHFDSFASREAGLMYECENSDVMTKYVNKQKNNTYFPIEMIDKIFKEQYYWWDDMVELNSAILSADPGNEDIKKIYHFENMKKDSNKTLENRLVVLARSLNIDVGPVDYPDLLMWKPLS